MLAFLCLMRSRLEPIEGFFNWAMRQTVKLQGDTNTNCAIVGGMVGAYVGLNFIDDDKLRKVLDCDHAKMLT